MGCGKNSSQAVALFFILFAIDWVPVRDDTRLGQLRFLLLVAFLASTRFLKKLVGAPLAWLYAYAGALWVLWDYQPHGMLHLVCVAAAIAAGKWLSDWEDLPVWIVRLGTVQAVFGLAQWLGWDPFGFSQPWFAFKPTGLQGQETLLGALLAACLAPAMFRGQWIPSLLIGACILATGSTMSLAAGGTVFMLCLWNFDRYLAQTLAVLVVAGAAIGYVLDPGNPLFSMTRREALWGIAWEAHLGRPIFGWGTGSWQPAKFVYLNQGVSHVHNEFLEFLVEYGRIGGALMVAALARFVWRFRFTWHHAMVSALLVNAIGNFPLHLAATGTLFAAGWILSERQGRIRECETWCRLLLFWSRCTQRFGRSPIFLPFKRSAAWMRARFYSETRK